jgi:hypothetical protein
VLERAADLLSEWDWCQGAARCGDAICAEGAVWFAVTGTLPHGQYVEPDGEIAPPLYFEACDAVSRFLGWPGLMLWNDAVGRTKAEVLARLRDAATYLREGNGA